ncbi:SAM-dependent methyltransferase [Colidextribacter sp. OB.20]|uniref:tRNA (adenine(22)-N(1))-methyltransferase n=1 Tax=Colidextribacter sp. OB.20 TaxID=2304568 RepID=UPI00136BA4D3|nr:class I SAM-dependent methyltransferase [Colidextribacter sp. OB.20]NBI08554.1 SAM-dependent methyltransferase [Colidextribacter sp. OB.20]
MRIELTPRLRMAAELVPTGVRLADVGTDHAYLPAALILEEKIPFAIAADLRQGPLARARETVRRAGLTGRVAFRLCDGLTGIRPDEVDAVVIAGMGGETIAAILEAAPWVRERDVPLILQPMSSMAELRGWLQGNGFRIEEERLAREGETLYTALSVRAGEMGTLSPAELWAGKNRADPLRGAWLDMWIARTGRALEGMSRARGEEVLSRKRALEEVRAGLLEMKKEWEICQK